MKGQAYAGTNRRSGNSAASNRWMVRRWAADKQRHSELRVTPKEEQVGISTTDTNTFSSQAICHLNPLLHRKHLPQNSALEAPEQQQITWVIPVPAADSLSSPISTSHPIEHTGLYATSTDHRFLLTIYSSRLCLLSGWFLEQWSHLWLLLTQFLRCCNSSQLQWLLWWGIMLHIVFTNIRYW